MLLLHLLNKGAALGQIQFLQPSDEIVQVHRNGISGKTNYDRDNN